MNSNYLKILERMVSTIGANTINNPFLKHFFFDINLYIFTIRFPKTLYNIYRTSKDGFTFYDEDFSALLPFLKWD